MFFVHLHTNHFHFVKICQETFIIKRQILKNKAKTNKLFLFIRKIIDNIDKNEEKIHHLITIRKCNPSRLIPNDN